jgi:hypothetical protein
VIADTGSFGHVCVGSFRDLPLALSNSGRCTLTVSNIASSSADFVPPNVSTFPLTVAPGTAIDVPIRFQPGSFGPKSGIVTVTSDDPSGPHTITVSGTAPAGKLTVTGSLCFGGV